MKRKADGADANGEKKRAALAKSWLYMIAEQRGDRSYPCLLADGEYGIVTRDEIVAQVSPCSNCDGTPYGGHWGHDTDECKLALDKDGNQVACQACGADFLETDEPQFCGKCGIAFHAKCMNESDKTSCMMCGTLTDTHEGAATAAGSKAAAVRPKAGSFIAPTVRRHTVEESEPDENTDVVELGTAERARLDARTKLAFLQRARQGAQREQ